LISELDKNETLVDEQQLGSRLNQSVQQGKRSDFALMLAMLEEDVRFHAQFKLPHIDSQLAPNQPENLRHFFELQDEQPLALATLDEIKSYNQAALVEQERLTDVRLQNLLTPKPLCFRDDVKHIPTSIMENTSIHCQRKVVQQNKVERSAFNANAWLKNIEKTLVESSALNMSA